MLSDAPRYGYNTDEEEHKGEHIVTEEERDAFFDELNSITT